MERKRLLIFVGFIFAVFFIVQMLFVPGIGFAEDPQYGGILKVSRSSESRGLGLPPTVKIGELYVGWPCVQALFRLNNEGLPSPNLAVSYEVDTNAMTILLRLRKGVKFHDMTDFNAEAVKFNIMTIYPEAGMKGLDKFIEDVKIIDDHTLEFKLNQWTNSFIDMASTKYGLMISPTAYKKHGKDWCHQNPVGTGPFKFVKWERDVMVKFEKFEHYYEKGKPYLDGIEYYIISDPMTQTAAFLNGEHHIMVDISPKDARDLENTGKYKITKIPGKYHQISGDGVNPDSVWANLKVRQAMLHAIDREAIAEAAGYGYWTVTPRHQVAQPGGWCDNPDVKGYEYNPEKAKQLLAEAGYPNGFKTTILTINQPQYVVDFMTAIQGQLRAVGIDGTLDLMDPGREFKVQVGGGWKDGILWVPTTFRNEAVLYHGKYQHKAIFHKSTARPKEFQDLVEKTIATPDYESMKKLMYDVQKMAVDKYAISNSLFIVSYLAAKAKNIHDDQMAEIAATNWYPENAWLSK